MFEGGVSEPFDSWVTLGHVGEWVSGGTPDTRYPGYWGGGTPWISAASLKGFDVFESDRRLTRLGVMAAGRLAPRGSVIFVVRGMSLANEFRVGVVGRPVAFGQDCKVIIPGGDVEGRFLAYFLLSKSDHFVRTAEAAGHGTKRLVTRFISEVKMPVLTLAKQREIIEILDSVDEAIRSSSARIEKLYLVREGLVADLLSGAEGGGKESLERVAEVASGVTLGGSLVGAGGKFPCITVANVQDGHLDLRIVKEILFPESFATRYLLRSGDFLITEGGDFDKLGRGAVWQGEITDCLYQNHIFRIRCDQSRLIPEFLSIYSASWAGKNYFRLASKQSTNLASINSTQVKSFPIPVISLEGQRRIVSIVQAHDERIAAERARLEKLRKLKTGLMDDLFTGRVRVDQLKDLPV